MTIAKAKYTEGNWKVRKYSKLDKNISVVDRNGNEIARVDNDDVAPGAGRANARAISKVPDLIEALTRLLMHEFKSTEWVVQQDVDFAKKVLTKATGLK